MSNSSLVYIAGGIGPAGPQGPIGPQGPAGSGGGASQAVTQTAHGFSVGQILYYNGTAYALAQANTAATSEVVGIVSAVADSNDFTLLNIGYISGLTGLTAGTTYYLSASSAGSLQNSDVATAGFVSKPLLYAVSSSAGYFFNQRGVLYSASQGASGNAYLAGINKLINGDMQVAQRGAGGSATFAIAAGSAGYGLDRWQVKANGTTAVTVTQMALNGKFWQQVARSASNAGTGLIQVGQTISLDNSYDLAGNPISLQLKAYAGSAFSGNGSTLTLKIYYGSGTTNVSGLTNSFTGETLFYTTTATLTTSAQLFTFSPGTLPSNATQVYVELSYTPTGTAPANTADGFYFTDVQLEVGSSSTSFQRKSFNQNLNDCLPYYEKTYPYPIAPKTNNTVTGLYAVTLGANNSYAVGAVYAFVRYLVHKIGTPQVNQYSVVASTPNTISSATGTSAASFSDGGGVGAATPSNISTEGFGLYQNYTAAFTANTNAFFMHYTVDADFV